MIIQQVLLAVHVSLYSWVRNVIWTCGPALRDTSYHGGHGTYAAALSLSVNQVDQTLISSLARVHTHSFP